MTVAQAPAPRRDRLKQLRAFCETARLGSISRAAEEVHLSQPAVSNQVRTLEEELGVVLFERRGPHIALTRVGEDLYRNAMPVVQRLLRLPALFAEAHHGVSPPLLRIGAGEVSAAYLLPRPLKRFQARYPGIRIEMRTGTGRERIEWLREFELDAVVGAVDAGLSDIEFHPMHTSAMVLATSEDHPLAARGPVEPAELGRYPLVAAVRGRPARRFHDTALRLYGVTPRVLVEVDGWGTILNHVAAGVGIAFVPDVCVVATEQVATVAVTARTVHRTYGVAVRRGETTSPVLRDFLAMAAPDPPGAVP